MKKLTVLLIIIPCICNLFPKKASAQDVTIIDSLDTPFEEQIEYILANLDLSEVSSGLLSEHGVPLFTLEPFDGTITDSSKSAIFVATNYHPTTKDSLFFGISQEKT